MGSDTAGSAWAAFGVALSLSIASFDEEAGGDVILLGASLTIA